MARARSAKPSIPHRDPTAQADAGSTLKPCPACGKREGKLVDRRRAKFPYAIVCTGCGFTTDWVRLPGVAVKLWSEAKKK